MRSLLICHHDAPLDRDGLTRWLASFSDLVGVVVITETRDAVRRRIRRQLKRVGPLRFLDVLAFRLWYRCSTAGKDGRWAQEKLARVRDRYPAFKARELDATTPNSETVREFIGELRPDIVIARTKFMMKKRVYEIPAHGTYVPHPGICPHYRNAHGCFWALSERDLGHVGLSLLRIDEGVDTGPVYGYYRYDFDEVAESHHRIQLRCLYENLDPIAEKFIEIGAGQAIPLDVEGQPSAMWGQPWLTSYLKWKRSARNRRRQ